MKSILYIIFSYPLFIIGQNKNLNKYIPYETTSYITHPIIEIKVWAHIIQKNEKNTQNFTKDSTDIIKQHFKWINDIYASINPPTLSNSKGIKPFIKDSRIRFNLDTITFHVNEYDWDRLKIVPEENKSKWLEILKIDPDSSTLLVKANRNLYSIISDSIMIKETRFSNGLYHVKKILKDGVNSLIFLEEDIFISEEMTGYVTCFKKIDKNCSDNNWIKYTNKNKNYLHIFYTGSSADVPGFGCGPSPFFLNISKANYGGKYAKAQLISHEIGHCLGLSHTNNPQFNDLPSSDKFGWIKCNDHNTSNNIMGYNTCRRYLSPLQIAYVHYRYSTFENLNFTLKNILPNNNTTQIKYNTKWEKNIIATGTIVVKKNQTLTVKKNLIIPENGIILLEKNGSIVVDGGKIYSPSKNWKGIKVINIKKRKKVTHRSPLIELLNNGTILY